MNNKVSIVVPVYNAEKYLAECIDSLLAQTYDNIEIILVDDGTKDSSGKICDEYASDHKNIKVIHKENTGAGLARNTGMEIAEGDYIAFVDSDDYADKTLIESLMNAIIKNDADTAFGGFKKVDDFHNVLFEKSYGNEIFSGEDCYKKCFKRMLGSNPGKHDALKISTWNSLYSMKIIRENNLKFVSERIFLSEDILFCEEYYKYSKKTVIIDNSCYNYRYNPNSLTWSYKTNQFKKTNDFYTEMENRVKKNFSDSKEAVQRLQCRYFIYLKVCLVYEKKSNSGFDSKTQKKNLEQICNDPLIIRILNEYPIGLLEFKQKVFVYLIKYKMIGLLSILLEKNIIK